jgi:hypothetical protein
VNDKEIYYTYVSTYASSTSKDSSNCVSKIIWERISSLLNMYRFFSCHYSLNRLCKLIAFTSYLLLWEFKVCRFVHFDYMQILECLYKIHEHVNILECMGALEPISFIDGGLTMNTCTIEFYSALNKKEILSIVQQGWT